MSLFVGHIYSRWRMEAIHTGSDVVSLFEKVGKTIKDDAVDTCSPFHFCANLM